MYREQNSPGSVDGCGCGSVEDGELMELQLWREGGREGGERWSDVIHAVPRCICVHVPESP